MKLKFNKKSSTKLIARMKNRVRIRRRLKGTDERPRLSVFKSGRHIYAQIIDDAKGVTIVAASTLKSGKGNNKEMAKAVGAEVAKKAISKNINAVVFDRSGYVYHGKIQALAEGAREAGLKF